ncbi:MAG: hypothetical protein GX442_19000 [Candidatus Riflebacteria bacterium]|nr:hypothetical protein [Candidatus Riflebacteria bacterium]
MSLQPPASGEGPVFDRPRPAGDSKFLVVKRWWTQATRSLLAGKPLFATGVPGPGQRCFAGKADGLFLVRPRPPERRFRPGDPAWRAGRRGERGFLPPPAWHPPQALPYFPRALPPVLRPTCQGQPGPADRSDRRTGGGAVFLSHPGPADHPDWRERPAVLHCLGSTAETARCRRILPGAGNRAGGPAGRLEPAGPDRREGWPEPASRAPWRPPVPFEVLEPGRLRPPAAPVWARPPAWPVAERGFRPGLAGAAAGSRLPLWQRAERPLTGLPRPPAWPAAPIAAPLLTVSRPGPGARGRLAARSDPATRAAWPVGPGPDGETGFALLAPGREPPPGMAPTEVPSPALLSAGATITPGLAPVSRVRPDPGRGFPPADHVARSALAPLAGLINTRFRVGFPPAVFRPLRTIRLQARLLRLPPGWETRPGGFAVLTPWGLVPAFPAGAAVRGPGVRFPDHADWERLFRPLKASAERAEGWAAGRADGGTERRTEEQARGGPRAVKSASRKGFRPARQPSQTAGHPAATTAQASPTADQSAEATAQASPVIAPPAPPSGRRSPPSSLRPSAAAWAARPPRFTLFPIPGTGLTESRAPLARLLPGPARPQPAPPAWRGEWTAFVQPGPVGPLAMRETGVSLRPPWRPRGRSDIASVGPMAVHEAETSPRPPWRPGRSSDFGPVGFDTRAGPFRDVIEMWLRPFPFSLLALEEPFNDIKDPPGRRRQPLRGSLFAWLPPQPHPKRTEPLRQYRLSFPTPPAGFQAAPRPPRSRLRPRRRRWPPLFPAPRSAFPRQAWKTVGPVGRAPSWRLAFTLETSFGHPRPPTPLALLEPASAVWRLTPGQGGQAREEAAPPRRRLPLPVAPPVRRVAEPPFVLPPPWAAGRRSFAPTVGIGPFPFGFPVLHEREGRLWLLHTATELPLLGRFALVDWPGPYLYQRRSRLRSPTNLRAPRRFLGPTLRLGTHFPYVMPFPDPFRREPGVPEAGRIAPCPSPEPATAPVLSSPTLSSSERLPITAAGPGSDPFPPTAAASSAIPPSEPATHMAAPSATGPATLPSPGPLGPRLRQPPHQARPRLPAPGPLPRLTQGTSAVLARPRPHPRARPSRLPLNLPASPFPFHQASPPPPMPDAGPRPGPLATSQACRSPEAWLRGGLTPPAVDAAAVGRRGTGPATVLDLVGLPPALMSGFLPHADVPAPACFPVPFAPLVPTLAPPQTRLYQGLPPSGFAPLAPRLEGVIRVEPAPALPFLSLEDEPCLSGLEEDGDFHVLQIRLAPPASTIPLVHLLPTRTWRPWAAPEPRLDGPAIHPAPAWSTRPAPDRHDVGSAPLPPRMAARNVSFAHRQGAVPRVVMTSRAALPWRGVFPDRLPALSRPDVPPHRLLRLRVAARFSAIGDAGGPRSDAAWAADIPGTDIRLPPLLHSPSSHWPVEAAGFARLALAGDGFPAGRNWPVSWGSAVLDAVVHAPADHGWLPSRRHQASRLPLFFRVRKDPLALALPKRPFPEPEVLVPAWTPVRPPPRWAARPVLVATPVLYVPESRFRVQVPAPQGFDEVLTGPAPGTLPAPLPVISQPGRDWRCPTDFPVRSPTPRRPPPRQPDLPDWLDLPTGRPDHARRPTFPIGF